MDSRARAYIDRWLNDRLDNTVRPKTMQSLWPGQPNALLAWFQDNRPEVMEKTKWVFMAKDFIRFKFTGEAHGELRGDVPAETSS